MLKYENLRNIFEQKNCKILKNEPLSDHTTFKIGGPADLFAEVPNQEILVDLLKYIRDNNIPFFIIGNGSNLLVADDGFRGIVIKLSDSFNNIKMISQNKLECRCGASLAKVCVTALQNGLSGLEFAWGIPGSCGGAIYMNAGAYNKDLDSILESSTHVTPDGNIQTIAHNQMKLSYRKSIYTDKNYVVISMILNLTPGNPDEIRKKMYENIKKRKSKQPLEYPNCGSVFKRPSGGYYAGSLIEQCGLKGKSIGGAIVSTKHAGFILNYKNATCKDVIELIKHIKQTVFNNTGIMLECEVRTLGNTGL